MSYSRIPGALHGVSASGRDEGEQHTVTCLLVVGPGGPEYSTCGLTTGYSAGGSLSFADAVAPLLGTTSPYGPVYFVFECTAAQDPSDVGKKGCISPINGNDGFGCGDDDFEASTTAIDVSAGSYSFVEAPPGLSPPHGSPSTGQTAMGTLPSPPSTPGQGAPGVEFHGVLVNPAPPVELTTDLGADPFRYPRECAFRADQIPSGDFGFEGGNTGAHGKIVSGSITAMVFAKDPPDPPPPPDPYSVQILFI